MTHADLSPLQDELEKSRTEVAEALERRGRTDRTFMNLRIGLFLAALIGFFATAASGDEIWSWTLLVPGLVLFVGAVRLHAPTRRELRRLERLRDLIAAKLARLDSEARPEVTDPCLHDPRSGSLQPAEEKAVALDEQVLEDLAVFRGRAQLMGLLDTTHTRLGRLRLADWLRHPSLDADEIRARQAAARELVDRRALRHRIEQRLRGLGRTPPPEAVRFLKEHPFRLNEAPSRRLLFGLLVVGLALTAAALVLANLVLMVAALALAGLGNLRFARALGEVPEVRDSFMAIREHLTALPALVADLEAAAPASRRLLAIEARLRDATALAGELRRGLAALSLYKAGLLYVVFSWLTFYDLLVLGPLLEHLRRGRDRLISALDAMAELEALVALATLAVEQQGYVFPEIAEAAPGLEIEEGLHPFLPSAGSRANSIRLDGENPVAVITGSNMTGKSTFLKMCGLNQLLAMIGAPVRAKSMRTKPLVLHSDINVKDSLDDGRSYFAVEVERIKAVLDDVAGGLDVLAILDEMFRGTNTDEKVAAGCEVTRYLARQRSLALVATHDKPFTRLEAEGLGIRNYHFAERIVGDRMVFDHRLEPGPARTRNAIRVLEIAGFPEEIVRAALERTTSDERQS